MKLLNEEIKPVELISLTSIALVLLGVFNLHSYYSLFGIDITQYLEPVEILFSFTSVFSSLVLTICIFAIFDMFANMKEGTARYFKENERWHSKVIKVMNVVIVIALMYFAFVWAALRNNARILEIVGFTLLAVYITATNHFVRTFSRKVLYICFALVLFFLIKNRLAFNRIELSGIGELNVEIKVGHLNISSSEDFVYIGSTSNYIFFWDRFSKKALTYPLKNTEWISSSPSVRVVSESN